MPTVMIRQACYQDCRRAVEEAFALFTPEITGRTVFVKPNVLRPAWPEEAITTHPAVLEAVVRSVLERSPAALVVGDNPGLMGYGANEASFERCGLMAASLGHYRNIGTDALPAPFLEEYGASLSVSRAALESDVFISVPKFKTHGLTGITGAIKNSYGILPGAQKAQLHRLAGAQERFHDLVARVFAIRPPDMIVLDAVLGMQGNGPASTELRWVGRVLASDNAVALDAAMARMMGLDPACLRFLHAARDLGLGDFRDDSYILDGELTPVPDFKTPPLGQDSLAHLSHIQRLLDERAASRPVVDRVRCVVCGVCLEQCPVQALSMADGFPAADPASCIACYCCQEMCPEKAIALTPPSAAGCPGRAGG